MKGRKQITKNENVKRIMDEKNVKALHEKLKEHSYQAWMHSIRVAEHIVDVCNTKKKTKEETDDLIRAALLMDIGYLEIPKEIIERKDGITAKEYKEIKMHVYTGSKIAKENGFSKNVCDIILKHHERYDGNGYLLKLKEGEIGEDCMLLSVVDVYEAMREDRPYREKYSDEYIQSVMMDEHTHSFSADSILTLITTLRTSHQ